MPNATPTQQSMIELLRQVPYLRQLPTEILTDLATVASCHHYSTGKMIFQEGEPAAGLFLVAVGSVKISRFTMEGREHILHIIEPGGTFNDVSTLDGGANPATAIAFTDTVVWRIARSDLQRVVKRHPALAWALLESMAARTRYLVGLVENLSMRSVKGRLAHLLLEQAEANQANAVPRYMTHEEMAGHLGTVREMIGRGLNSLAAAGIIQIDRHQITILDAERLAAEAEV